MTVLTVSRIYIHHYIEITDIFWNGSPHDFEPCYYAATICGPLHDSSVTSLDLFPELPGQWSQESRGLKTGSLQSWPWGNTLNLSRAWIPYCLSPGHCCLDLQLSISWTWLPGAAPHQTRPLVCWTLLAASCTVTSWTKCIQIRTRRGIYNQI